MKPMVFQLDLTEDILRIKIYVQFDKEKISMS